MTANDQENEKTGEPKSELFYNRGKRRDSDLNLFAVIDREYILNLPEGNQQKSSLSTLIYVLGVIIFLMGAMEGFTAAQLAATSSISELQLSGIGLLTAFLTGVAFVGFGKVVEFIIFRHS